jgi:hypothetical protein
MTGIKHQDRDVTKWTDEMWHDRDDVEEVPYCRLYVLLVGVVFKIITCSM